MEMMDMEGMSMGMMGGMMIGMILVAIALFFVVAAVFRWLWNITIPDASELRRSPTGRDFG